MKLLKKNKTEAKMEKRYIVTDSMVYTEHLMSLKERIITYIIGFLAGFIVGYIMYSSITLSIIFGVVVGFIYIPIRRKGIIEKQTRVLRIQFKDLLESISTSISAGKNVSDSFVSAYGDLKNQYSEDAFIVKEVNDIIQGMHNNINIEVLLLDLAERSGIDDIISFANVFDTCYRKGGNLKEVIKSTYKIINDKMEIEMEIDTMVASAKTEQNMMLVMPILFMFILNTMGSGLTGQGTAISKISTTVAMIFFAIAYFVSKKIMTIKL